MTACDRPKEELTLYVYEGELNPEERAAVEQHLQGCAACRAEVDELRSVMNDLDIWAVPEPPSSRWALFEARLETHIAPLRARRLATSGSRWRWAARLAAAVMVGGLTALSLGLYKQNQTQRSEIATLSVRLGDSEFDAGRIASAKRHYDMGGLALTSGPSEDRSRARRQEALPALLECDERLTRLWAQARNSIGQEQEQFLTEICYEFSEHPFADEAFLSLRRILENQPARRVRPLEFVALQPLRIVPERRSQVDPGDEVYEQEFARLMRFSKVVPSEEAKAFALLRAARLVEEGLGDAARAQKSYRIVLRRIPSGPIRAVAEARLKSLTQ